MYSTSYSCQILIKLEFSGQIFEKYSNNNFNENPSSGGQVVPCARTERRKDRHDEANSCFFLQFYDRDRRCVALYFTCTLRPHSVVISEGYGKVCLYLNQLATNPSDGVVQNCMI